MKIGQNKVEVKWVQSHWLLRWMMGSDVLSIHWKGR